ncbi:hypothetical protein H1V43_33760 [Streptomyces sp. PSKA54]|uniref:Uncharacterized protein n=1 Tax=Streptomyces himalayensis subsp. aureolus TaxID=2758039 RepID=A0A7W2D7I2_9ACTN|nr:hypothetical protein [Streptomyces himalayensis]MBA4866202.1 hypothetical protein [Streptomyces himalayensis subsp. aureolus]
MPDTQTLLIIPAVLLVSLAGTFLLLWQEKHHPSSYSRRPDVLDAWRGMSAAAQAAHDNAVLDAADAAENAVARAAVESAAKTNALFRP